MSTLYSIKPLSERFAAHAGAILLLCSTQVVAERENPATTLELPSMEVIGTTPLSTLGQPINKFPGNVQTLSADTIEDQNNLDLSESLYKNLGSVTINATQNNPFQNDVFYRGFLASPLVGSAIGLSVYMDGVRINEGFGDTINWDLIPQAAIAGIDVIPGSNPLFGLNTLGGALSIRTKSGFAFQGTKLEGSGGSWGRASGELEHGGHLENLDWYLTFNYTGEDGWRDRSPSELYQLFGKVGWETDATDIDLSYIFADTDLIGNGFAPESLLARDRDAVHTFPDNTQNRLHFVNLRASHWLMDELLLSGNAFYRDFERDTLNGDAEVECVDDITDNQIDVHLGLCQGSAVPFGGVGGLELEAEGEDRTTTTDTENWGGTLQATRNAPVFGFGNTITFGGAYDRNQTRFTQNEAGSELFEAGLSHGTLRTEAFSTEVEVKTTQENWALYLTDTFDVTEQLSLTFSGRYQHVDITIRDQTGELENQDLNGDHTFERFNPSGGLTFRWSPELNFFASYSEGFRAPTPAELTCADPDDPCNLPNAFAADPPLDPVIARTYEIGLRGKLPVGDSLRWNLAFYRTDLNDDLLFTQSETGGGGFFQNVGKTRRQGVEAGLNGSWEALRFYLNYAYIDATSESRETLASVIDPAGVAVDKGDQLPGIPQHSAKIGIEYDVFPIWSIGTNVIAASGVFIRGDESNDLPKTDAYAVWNLYSRVKIGEYFELWTRVDNILDTQYETAGARNFNAFADSIAEERFVAPGSPRAAWGGVKIRF